MPDTPAVRLAPVPAAASAGPVEEPRTTEAGDHKARVNKKAEREARIAAALAAVGGPLAVDTDAAAALCGLARSTFFRARAAGKTPKPVRILGKVLYLVADLKLWAELGFCDRREFEARRAANGRK